MKQPPALPAEDTKTVYFRIKNIVPELGGQLDENPDFEFYFTKPRTAVVRFAHDKGALKAMRTTTVCTATCRVEIPDAIAEKLGRPLKDRATGLSAVRPSELAAIDEIYTDLTSLLQSTIDLFRWRHG